MSFVPAWYLRSPHLQTIWGRVTRERSLVQLRREVLCTPDDDDLVIDHLDLPPRGFRFVLLHGLEGSSYSVYMQGMLALIRDAGFPAVAMNFRSCARDPKRHHVMLPNRKPRFYHSGETGDLAFLLDHLRSAFPGERFLLFGASLGGNQIVKFLGEGRDTSGIAAAAVMSVPFDLAAGSRKLESPLGLFYTWTFHRTLKKKAFDTAARFPEAARKLDLEKIRDARTFREFDGEVVAPLHGFESADDYYARASSIRYIHALEVPTLAISAEDDPFLPVEVLDEVERRKSSMFVLERQPFGGHCGFVASPGEIGCRYWGEARAVQFLVQHTV